jgi:hypothetical protein
MKITNTSASIPLQTYSEDAVTSPAGNSHGITSQTKRNSYPQPDPNEDPPSTLIPGDLDHPVCVKALDDTENYTADKVRRE